MCMLYYEPLVWLTIIAVLMICMAWYHNTRYPKKRGFLDSAVVDPLKEVV